jgi:hypothetical protein
VELKKALADEIKEVLFIIYLYYYIFITFYYIFIFINLLYIYNYYIFINNKWIYKYIYIHWNSGLEISLSSPYFISMELLSFLIFFIFLYV